MSLVGKAIIDDAGGAVTLAIGLIGVMALFLGLMKVAEAGGLLNIIARLLRPLMQRLFPGPVSHPAMGAMILNISANVLGLGNAATPFGIGRCSISIHSIPQRDRDQLDGAVPGNQHLQRHVVADKCYRAAGRGGLGNPAGILPTTLFATFCSTAVAIVLAKTLERWWPVPAGDFASRNAHRLAHRSDAGSEELLNRCRVALKSRALSEVERGYPAWVSGLAMLFMLLLIPLTILFGREIAPWIMGRWPACSASGRLVACASMNRSSRGPVTVFRSQCASSLTSSPFSSPSGCCASGALDLLIRPIGATTAPLGLPAEALLMGMLRALSGSAHTPRFGVERSGNRPRQLYRLSRQHHSARPRRPLRSRGLLRRGWRRTYAACRARWPHSRCCRPACFGLICKLCSDDKRPVHTSMVTWSGALTARICAVFCELNDRWST